MAKDEAWYKSKAHPYGDDEKCGSDDCRNQNVSNKDGKGKKKRWKLLDLLNLVWAGDKKFQLLLLLFCLYFLGRLGSHENK